MKLLSEITEELGIDKARLAYELRKLRIESFTVKVRSYRGMLEPRKAISDESYQLYKEIRPRKREDNKVNKVTKNEKSIAYFHLAGGDTISESLVERPEWKKMKRNNELLKTPILTDQYAVPRVMYLEERFGV